MATKKKEELNEFDIARRLATFAHKSRYGVDLWKYKNICLGLLFLAEADPEGYGEIYKELFLETEKEPKYSSVVECLREEIDLSKYDWLNDFIKWDHIFLGYEPSEYEPLLLDLIDYIDDLVVGSKVDIGMVYMNLIDAFGNLGGKAYGEFFTPNCLVELISKIWERLNDHKEGEELRVYDPACGCGNLYNAFQKVPGVKCYGQEISPEVVYVLKMHMILRGWSESNLVIKRGDTLRHDLHRGLVADVCAVNPPFNVKWDNCRAIDFEDFKAWGGYAPNSAGDLAFLQRSIAKLREGGLGFCIVYPQVLTRDGGEALIRREIFKRKHVLAVVDFPCGLFYSTTVATALVIFTKTENSKTLFINALDMGRRYTRGKILIDGEIEKIASTVVSFAKDQEGFVGDRNFATAIDLSSPETYKKMPEIRWSLSPLDHLNLTQEEIIRYFGAKNINRQKAKTNPRIWPDRSMYSERC